MHHVRYKSAAAVEYAFGINSHYGIPVSVAGVSYFFLYLCARIVYQYRQVAMVIANLLLHCLYCRSIGDIALNPVRVAVQIIRSLAAPAGNNCCAVCLKAIDNTAANTATATGYQCQFAA